MSHVEQFQHLKIQLEAILSATNNFSAASRIGNGGFGEVYKGELNVHSKGKTMVALKRLNTSFGQGFSEFWREIMLLSFYKHENIVSLLGYCDANNEKILVYEYASNKSLDSCLDRNDLTWVQRLKICIGAARGLVYLHTPTENRQRILHRDIKSANILLDHNWNAKISDFGLSRWAPAYNQFTYMGSSNTLYQDTGYLTKESDVYSFGVVLFEVLCGMPCIGNQYSRPLPVLVREYYKHNKIIELVYSNIKDERNMTSLRLFAYIAYRCLSKEREKRPSMNEILNTLVRVLNIQVSFIRLI
ncbi:putative protein kinase RLK-Pelle-CrRLK1L-1 family [Helianthus anomalus]